MRGARLILLAAPVLGWIFLAAPALGESGLKGEVKVSSGVRPMDLIVYLADPPVTTKVSPSVTAIMDQRNQAFHPHVLAVVQGTTVKFPNSDRVAHNVFSLSSTKVFDLGKITPNTSGQVTFEKPGIVEVLCGFHSRMLAYIRVMEHPYFAIPDAQGRFVIQGVPPGTYQLRIWHESLKEVSRQVKATSDQAAPIQIQFPR